MIEILLSLITALLCLVGLTEIMKRKKKSAKKLQKEMI